MLESRLNIIINLKKCRILGNEILLFFILKLECRKICTYWNIKNYTTLLKIYAISFALIVVDNWNPKQ